MSDRFQKAACTAMLILACCMCVIPGVLQCFPDSRDVFYAASGREAVFPDISVPAGTVSVNSGSAEELQELPGIGETLSQLILSERLANGDYYYPEDLTAVKGIGMKKLEQFRELLDFSEGGD